MVIFIQKISFESHFKFIIEQLKQTQAFKQFVNAQCNVKRALWRVDSYICIGIVM